MKCYIATDITSPPVRGSNRDYHHNVNSVNNTIVRFKKKEEKTALCIIAKPIQSAAEM